ncbi:hypothetical protein [Candidatus Chlorobium masyuteum]|uniref:hypothetical protein n=1 Tax=Candidatus Chlorobium masyuteum TaxID=2716876 RepID=UPI00142315CB|nr:hypothetical protein [Candidatus Chlorobium masyuteum]
MSDKEDEIPLVVGDAKKGAGGMIGRGDREDGQQKAVRYGGGHVFTAGSVIFVFYSQQSVYRSIA